MKSENVFVQLSPLRYPVIPDIQNSPNEKDAEGPSASTKNNNADATVTLPALDLPGASEATRYMRPILYPGMEEFHQNLPVGVIRVREKTYDLNLLSTLKIPAYEPLLDKYLRDFFNSPNTKRLLMKQGIVEQNGHIVDLLTYKNRNIHELKSQEDENTEKAKKLREWDRSVEVAIRRAISKNHLLSKVPQIRLKDSDLEGLSLPNLLHFKSILYRPARSTRQNIYRSYKARQKAAFLQEEANHRLARPKTSYAPKAPPLVKVTPRATSAGETTAKAKEPQRRKWLQLTAAARNRIAAQRHAAASPAPAETKTAKPKQNHPPVKKEPVQSVPVAPQKPKQPHTPARTKATEQKAPKVEKKVEKKIETRQPSTSKESKKGKEVVTKKAIPIKEKGEKKPRTEKKVVHPTAKGTTLAIKERNQVQAPATESQTHEAAAKVVAVELTPPLALDQQQAIQQDTMKAPVQTEVTAEIEVARETTSFVEEPQSAQQVKEPPTQVNDSQDSLSRTNSPKLQKEDGKNLSILSLKKLSQENLGSQGKVLFAETVKDKPKKRPKQKLQREEYPKSEPADEIPPFYNHQEQLQKKMDDIAIPPFHSSTEENRYDHEFEDNGYDEEDYDEGEDGEDTDYHAESFQKEERTKSSSPVRSVLLQVGVEEETANNKVQFSEKEYAEVETKKNQGGEKNEDRPILPETIPLPQSRNISMAELEASETPGKGSHEIQPEIASVSEKVPLPETLLQQEQQALVSTEKPPEMLELKAKTPESIPLPASHTGSKLNISQAEEELESDSYQDDFHEISHAENSSQLKNMLQDENNATTLVSEQIKEATGYSEEDLFEDDASQHIEKNEEVAAPEPMAVNQEAEETINAQSSQEPQGHHEAPLEAETSLMPMEKQEEAPESQNVGNEEREVQENGEASTPTKLPQQYDDYSNSPILGNQMDSPEAVAEETSSRPETVPLPLSQRESRVDLAGSQKRSSISAVNLAPFKPARPNSSSRRNSQILIASEHPKTPETIPLPASRPSSSRQQSHLSLEGNRLAPLTPETIPLPESRPGSSRRASASSNLSRASKKRQSLSHSNLVLTGSASPSQERKSPNAVPLPMSRSGSHVSVGSISPARRVKVMTSNTSLHQVERVSPTLKKLTLRSSSQQRLKDSSLMIRGASMGALENKNVEQVKDVNRSPVISRSSSKKQLKQHPVLSQRGSTQSLKKHASRTSSQLIQNKSASELREPQGLQPNPTLQSNTSQ